ncbi:MAG: hypothetical protein KatS3mg076_2026 [Candidatus Binatia bacterium]|nr:MAG: hypothetical protein KatS3mg076_2026 [Candidatus Binatia bacterium]
MARRGEHDGKETERDGRVSVTAPSPWGVVFVLRLLRKQPRWLVVRAVFVSGARDRGDAPSRWRQEVHDASGVNSPKSQGRACARHRPRRHTRWVPLVRWIYVLWLCSTGPAFAEDPPVAYALTNDSVFRIDPETGLVLERIEVGSDVARGARAIVSDGGRVFIIRDLDVVVLDLETKEMASFFVPCCTTGWGAVVQDRIYVGRGEFFEFSLDTFDARTGRGLRSVPLPSDVRALTVVGAIPARTTTPPSGCFGDYDRDGMVTAAELVRLVANIFGGCPDEEASSQ